MIRQGRSLTGTLVELPCSQCGKTTLTLQRFAAPHRVGFVRCPDCTPPALPEEQPQSAWDYWRARTPAPFRDANLTGIDDMLTRSWMEAIASRWPEPVPSASGPVRVVCLHGPTGIGKTAAGWAFLHELVRTGRLAAREICVGTEQELVVPEAAQSRWEPHRPFVRALAGKRLVMVDDVGHAAMFSAEQRIGTYKALIDRVRARDLFLILTSNASSLADLEEVLGPATFSRVTEHMIALIPGERDRRTGRAHPPRNVPA